MTFDSLTLRGRKSGKIFARRNKNCSALRVDIIRNAARAAEQHCSGRISGDVDENFFGTRRETLFFRIGSCFEGLRSLANGEFAKGDKSGFLKESCGFEFRSFLRINRSAFKAM